MTTFLLLAVLLGLLALVLRWAFGNDRRAVPDYTGDDFGLLREVAEEPTAEAAQALAGRLRAAGIRATVVSRGGAHRLMVFPADLAEARLLLRR
ncbi:SPOR domain-containing protein [Saccharothrix coeruleofusca]|uniref:SPOR domain-containing protein n=1 Tax=Saccharothrix coeruleofusca TaxID=33919 RepID=A0A918AID4_9PSEU|nr:SPOR domain-containing protein [Saccharothrix coeruleofusca]MBP2338759.1 hypothetical protein [Saccharothrix coeruleofusca]GGP46157.1 hypothetical protein GCM10010185_17250 [Saccharothrix coeruleofusca]